MHEIEYNRRFPAGRTPEFSENYAIIYGTLNVLTQNPANGESQLWVGYNSNDNSASQDHNRLHIKSTGVVTTDDLLMKTAADAVIDISSGGRLVVKGNEKAEIDGYVAAGSIGGNGIAGNVTVTYNSGTNETVIGAATSSRSVQFLAGSAQVGVLKTLMVTSIVTWWPITMIWQFLRTDGL